MLPNGVCVYDHENGSFFLFPPHQICFLRSINAFAWLHSPSCGQCDQKLFVR
jgi:hypothetical protein